MGNLFDGYDEKNWQMYTPYENLSPEFEKSVLGGETVLSMSAAHARTFGQWRTTDLGAHPGTWRMEIDIKYEGIAHFEGAVSVLITWMDRSRNWLQRDYIDELEPGGDWSVIARTVTAPKETALARVELMLRHSVGGVQFKNPRLYEVEPIPPRLVTLASACYRFGHTLEENRSLLCAAIDRAAQAGADIVCLSETMYGRGAGAALHESAVKIPGDLTQALGEHARAGNLYVVVSLDEEEDGYYYNSSILIGRDGLIKGKYRKTHLPLTEIEDGVLPGDDIPVFDTDFGRIGMMVCWDQMFPEVARVLRIKGAEVIFLPTAGPSDIQSACRAVENSVYVVMTHSYMESESKVIAPTGEVIARAQKATDGLALARVDLNKRYYQMWLSVGPCYGDTRPAYMRERRIESFGEILTSGR